MKRNVIIAILGICIICSTGCKTEPDGPNLDEHYNYKSADPFGTEVAYKMLAYNFGKRMIEVSKEPIKDARSWWSHSGALYVNISENFYIDETSAEEMLDFVRNGNTALISASQFDPEFLAQLNVEQIPKYLRKSYADYYLTETQVSFVSNDRLQLDKYSYFYMPFENGFMQNRNQLSKNLGYSENHQIPNTLILFWGRGKFILHLEPRSLSNYFLLTDSNHAYFKSIMEYFPMNPNQVYWDDYYRTINYSSSGKDSFSTLSTIFQHPPLRWAFYAALFLLILYILVNGKRRQRIVPVIQPSVNSSIAFTEAVARLYLKEDDNKAIADKMILFFNESIRSRYFMNSHQMNDQFIDTIHKKSGIAKNKVQELYTFIQYISNNSTVTDGELLRLNELFQYFYKNKKG